MRYIVTAGQSCSGFYRVLLLTLTLALAAGCGREVRYEALPSDAIVLVENTRFTPMEEANDPQMAQFLATLGDIYCNDAFSAAHRAHASTEGVAHHLQSCAGRLMQMELEALEKALGTPERPVAACSRL